MHTHSVVSRCSRRREVADVQVRDLDYSPDGQNLLVISGTNQAKVYNREGEAETA